MITTVDDWYLLLSERKSSDMYSVAQRSCDEYSGFRDFGFQSLEQTQKEGHFEGADEPAGCSRSSPAQEPQGSFDGHSLLQLG